MKQIFFIALFLVPSLLYSATDVGLDVYNNIENLPKINPLSFASGFSSYERNGGNVDRGEFLYQDGSEYVMTDVRGPGAVYRLWTTGQDGNALIKFYLDGAETPQINLSFNSFYNGITAPFLSPLNGDNLKSSGGFYSYLPITFSNSCRITSTDNDLYYNVGMISYPALTNVETWTGSEDSSTAQAAWDNVGNPIGNYTDTLSVTGTFNLASGEENQLVNLAGQRIINSIRLIYNDLPVDIDDLITNITDNGRAHKGYSQFTVSIPSNNNGIRLVRRMNYGIPNQKSKISVDGNDVGEWYDIGQSYEGNVWCDSSFLIPESFTTGKTTLTIRITFLYSDVDWNEFYYWVYAIQGQNEILADELDVADTIDEATHSYSISNMLWTGDATFKYRKEGVVADYGRAFTGNNQFIISVPTNNNGVRLVRRLDYAVANQKANVYINGNYVGEWFDAGADGTYRWRDNSFSIPGSFTSGESALTVNVQFVSSLIDWNEFFYWVYAIVDTNELLVDRLDIGNSYSENNHNYSIVNQAWFGVQKFEYYISNVINDITLEWGTSVWINAKWDNREDFDVNVPIGMFFGNVFGGDFVQSIFFGFKTNKEHYCYFPMPFGNSATIKIINKSNMAFSNIWYEIKHSALTENINNLGLFHATYNSKHLINDGKDYCFLETEGYGKLVGIVQLMKGGDLNRGYLEGDERFYIDGSKTPSLYGTGTEDYYNGGWYFNQGIFSLPLHGNQLHEIINGRDITACYRIHWPNTIPFRSSIRAGIEHGPNNEWNAEYSSVAFWYGRPSISCLTLIDSIDIGTAASEAAHLYTNGGNSISYSMTSSYEGDDSNIMISDTGCVHNSFSKFRVAVIPNTEALLIRRRSDHTYTNQTVNVEVNGRFAGQWLLAGYNQFATKWIDDEFIIPSEFITNSVYADIQLTTANGALWSEFRYDIFAVSNPAIPEPSTLFVMFLALLKIKRYEKKSKYYHLHL